MWNYFLLIHTLSIKTIFFLKLFHSAWTYVGQAWNYIGLMLLLSLDLHRSRFDSCRSMQDLHWSMCDEVTSTWSEWWIHLSELWLDCNHCAPMLHGQNWLEVSCNSTQLCSFCLWIESLIVEFRKLSREEQELSLTLFSHIVLKGRGFKYQNSENKPKWL